MIQYPNDKSKGEYIGSLLDGYRDKYPNLVEEQILIAIQYVVSSLEYILNESIVVSSETQLCHNVETLGKLLDLTFEQYQSLSGLNPQLLFDYVYALSVPREGMVKFMLSECNKGADVLEGSDKEMYLTCVREITHQCVNDITQATENAIPDAVKQKYNQNKHDK